MQFFAILFRFSRIFLCSSVSFPLAHRVKLHEFSDDSESNTAHTRPVRAMTNCLLVNRFEESHYGWFVESSLSARPPWHLVAHRERGHKFIVAVAQQQLASQHAAVVVSISGAVPPTKTRNQFLVICHSE